MRKVSQKAKAVMDLLTKNITNLGDHDKFSAPGFMDVCIEAVDKCNLGAIISIAHYYEQQGDLMADPEMLFIRAEDGDYYPFYYRQDGLGIEQNSVIIDDGKVTGIKSSLQRDHAIFAGQWMANIKMQHGEGLKCR